MAPGKGFRSVAQYNAALFDLDGVLTPTIILHKAAWKQLFDEALPDSVPPYTEQDYFTYVVNPALLTQMEIANQDYEILQNRGVVHKAQMAATIMRDMEELQAAIEANPQDEQLKATFMQKDEQLKTLQDPQIDELMNVIAKGDSVKQAYGEAILAMCKEIGLVQPPVTDITEDMPKNVRC